MLCRRCLSFGTGRTSTVLLQIAQLSWHLSQPGSQQESWSSQCGAARHAWPSRYGFEVRQVLGPKMLPGLVAKIYLSLMNSTPQRLSNPHLPGRQSAAFSCRQARLWSHSCICLWENQYFSLLDEPVLKLVFLAHGSQERESGPCKANGDYRKVCWRKRENGSLHKVYILNLCIGP